MNLGEAIKRRREDLGFARQELAEWSGMDYDKLLRVEGGDPRITTQQAVNICDALGCTLSELIKEAECYDAVCAGY